MFAASLPVLRSWLQRHAAAAVFIGGLAVVIVFTSNVWLRLTDAHNTAATKAFDEVDALGKTFASLLALTQHPESEPETLWGATEETLRSHVSAFLGMRKGLVQLSRPDGLTLWVSADHVVVSSHLPSEWSEIVERGDHPAVPDETYKRLYLGKPGMVRNNLAVRAAVAETDLLTQFIGRRNASVLLVPLFALVVLAMVGVASVQISRAMRNAKRLHALATVDQLTGLLNRASFNEALAEEAERAQGGQTRLGLLFLDLDNFKYVNDSLGHDVGDGLLRVVAQRLRASVRANDVVCRLGGDEFTIILRDLPSESEAELVATRLLKELSEPVNVAGTQVLTQASIGLAFFGTDATDASNLVRCADLAVYRAKSMGKSCFMRYSPDLAMSMRAYTAVTQDMRGGLARHEFELVYQPKTCLRTQAVTGFEALVRWNHPTQGVISPVKFIPIAEQTGLIIPLGDYIIDKTVAQVRAWHDAGHGWTVVAVNVSAVQLRNHAIIQTLDQALKRYGVPGQAIQVELTESTLAADLEMAADIISRLKGLGVSVAVDDFGTGYSSLSALSRFRVDYLKVDRSFVSPLLEDANSLEICRAIIGLAHSLKLRVIAEGVETKEQQQVLQDLGCDEIQGYLVSRPLSAEKVEPFLMQNRGHPLLHVTGDQAVV